LQGEHSLKLLAKAQIVGLVRITETNNGASNCGNGANVILWIKPQLVDE
jgi:hypothetical protein